MYLLAAKEKMENINQETEAAGMEVVMENGIIMMTSLVQVVEVVLLFKRV